MIIRSILDTDYYKLSQQYAILTQYHDAKADYAFILRKPVEFQKDFLGRLTDEIQAMSHLQITADELKFLSQAAPYLPPQYLAYLKDYRYDPREVKIELQNGFLDLNISGLWHRTVLWEVPLMALISELYFQESTPDLKSQAERAKSKADFLDSAKAYFMEFGTRRRRSFEVQNIVFSELCKKKTCWGTSNPYLAKTHGTQMLGTVAHEWTMGISVLEGLRHANRFAMDKWREVYGGNLSIALTDTYGSDAFFADFDLDRALSWRGLRQDSGSPYDFYDKTIAHYQKLGIDPSTKTIVYSDSLDVNRAVEIKKHCPKTKSVFGIGTHFSNDSPTGPAALNMVIKLTQMNGVPVVKLSDDPGKAIGDQDAVRVVNWMMLGKPLGNY